MQGTLPVLNADMVRKGVLAGLALNSSVALQSKFDRKQYFYPDLPKGYQISQYDVPLCEGGWVEVIVPEGPTGGGGGGSARRIGITRAHLEEDAGKLVHGGAASLSGSDYSLVDYNRGGVPLLEIVSEPDMRTGAEAAAYGAEVRRIMRFLDVSGARVAALGRGRLRDRQQGTACPGSATAGAVGTECGCHAAGHAPPHSQPRLTQLALIDRCFAATRHLQMATWLRVRCGATSTSLCGRGGGSSLGPRLRSRT